MTYTHDGVFMIEENKLTETEMIAARRTEALNNGIFFNRFFFKQTFGSKMIVNSHHLVIQRALDRTMLPPDDPEFIPRLIINISPGYGKTLQAVINYIARGLAVDPANRFLHLSYSSALAMQNSAAIRDIVKSRTFQSMFPFYTKEDTDSKSMWWTEQSGGMYATAAGGQVTGFRAGHMNTEKFTGALVIDDPLKPDDAYYDTKRELINNRFNETIASRLAVETVPIIVIMQRLHYNDLSGYLLKGGSGEQWYHLNLPIKMDHSTVYPDEYTHGIPIDTSGIVPEGWLWDIKHNDKHEVALRSHRRKFAAQYMQAPMRRNEEAALWNEDILNLAKLNPFDSPSRTVVSVDPAVTNNDTSDWHGIVVTSQHDKDQYTVDADYTCKGSPVDWANKAIAAYKKHKADAIVIEVNQGGDMCEQTLRNAGFKGRIIKVHAAKGKVARAEPIAALYEQGFVKHHSGLADLEEEMLDLDPISGKAGGKSPNRVDALVWGLTNLSQGVEMGELLRLVVNR